MNGTACALEVRGAQAFERDAVILGSGLSRNAAALWQETRDLQEDHWSKGGEAAGLVSVPTSGPAFTAGQARANVESSIVERASGVCAFESDRDVRRLSMLRRGVGFAARAHAVSEKGKRSDVPYMVTLTYRPGVEYAPRHISSALHSVRKWAARKGFVLRYVWVGELQKRGALHYHLCIWLPRGVRMPKWDARGWWPHGMSNRVVARNAVSYLMKYLSKGTDVNVSAAFGKGVHIYGVGGLDHALRRARRWLGLPAFVQGNSSIFDEWKRAEPCGVRRGGWISPECEHFASEFRQIFVGGRRFLQRVLEHPRQLDASGPFSWLTDKFRALGLVGGPV